MKIKMKKNMSTKVYVYEKKWRPNGMFMKIKMKNKMATKVYVYENKNKKENGD